MQVFARLIATWGFSGYAPIAPGTAGSAVALALYWLVGPLQRPEAVLICAVVFFAGVWSASQMEKQSGIKDPSIVVVDEVVGMWISLLFLPAAIHWIFPVAGFFLFRFFDIVKPWPARRLERLSGGWGIMIDDVIAGLYSLAAIHLIYHLSIRLAA